MSRTATFLTKATPQAAKGVAPVSLVGRPLLQRKASGPTRELTAPPIVQEVLRSPGQPLDAATRAFMEPRFGHDFSRVRIHANARAAESARAVNARAYTVGSHIVFGTGQSGPTESGRRLLAHELIHTLQQRQVSPLDRSAALAISNNPTHEAEADMLAAQVGAGTRGKQLVSPHSPALQLKKAAKDETPVAPPTSLDAYPEVERRRIQVSTVPALALDAAFFITAFGTDAERVALKKSAGSLMVAPNPDTVVFGANIPDSLQLGLTLTGGYLTNSTTNVLPTNSTVTLALDLTPYSGPNALFRFTRIEHDDGEAVQAIMLIENVGSAPAAASVPDSVPTGTFTVRDRSFTIGSGWDVTQFGQLQAALALLPDAVLDEAAGVTFSRRGAGTDDEAGNYDDDNDEVVLHSNAFPTSPSRFGTSESGTRNIVHEVGHVLDLRRLHRAWVTFDDGKQTKAGQKTLFKARSLSGTRWELKPPTEAETEAETETEPKIKYSPVEDRLKGSSTNFRKAAKKDGIAPGKTDADPLKGGPTDYANTDWQELFAEAFSLYVTDPALFKNLRPHLYDYFVKDFPLPVATATTTAAASADTQP